MAHESDINPNEISRWLRGEHDPRISSAIRLADAMDLILDELLRGHIPDAEMLAILERLRGEVRAKDRRDSQATSSGTTSGA